MGYRLAAAPWRRVALRCIAGFMALKLKAGTDLYHGFDRSNPTGRLEEQFDACL